MKTLYALLFFIFLSLGVYSQPKLYTGEFDNQSGTGGSKDYSTGWTFEASAFNSYRFVGSVGTTGDAYFRFLNNAATTNRQPSGADGTSIPTNQTSAFTAIQDGNSKAFKVAGAVTGYRYVFKVDAAINNIAIFQIQGTNVRTVSTVARTTPAGTVYPGQDVLITATLSGAFDAGQSAYLRYTTDAWATSSIIKMTGSGTSYTATIPGVDNRPSTQNQYYVFTSGDVASIATADADLFTINANNNGGTNYNYTPASGWTTAATGNWSAGATWVGGGVPPTNANMGTVTIGHAVTLNQSALAGSVVLNTATANILTLSAGQTLSIASGGSITRSSTATISANATSTLRFLGSGSIGWLNTWGNLETGGTLTTTGVQTITTSFQINSGGSISATPTYTATSTLIYNSGGSYGVGNEWTATSDAVVGSGLPQNVTIQNSTTLNMTTTSRAMAGNLTISSGTLALNATSGDLNLRGNWSNSGTFTPNGRAVFFRGAATTTVSKTGGETFDFLVLAKTAAVNLQLLSNVTVAGGSGFPLQLTNTVSGGGIDLNGFNLTLSGAASSILIGNAAVMTRNISGTGNLNITTGTKTVSRNALAGGTLVIASTVNVQLSSGIDFGASLTTHNGTLTINAGGFVSTNPPIYSATSNLVYNSGGSYAVGNEWTATVDNVAASGLPQNVTIQNSTTLNMPTTTRAMAGNMTITSGTLALNATSGDLSLRGNWSNSGTFTPNGRAVFFAGIAASTVSKTGGETFDYLIVQKTGAFNLQFLSNVTVAASTGNVLQLNNTGTSSGIDLNGFNLNLTGTAGNIDLAGGALIRTISGTGNVNISGGTKTVTRSVTSTLTIAGAVNVQLGNGINFGASVTTLNGTLSINAGGFVSTNPPLYGLTSNLIYNSGGAYALSSEWTSAVATATVTAGRPGNVTIQNNTDLTMTTTSRALYGNLNISSGSLSLSAVSGDFLVGGNWTRSATGATFNQNGRTVQFFSVASGLSTTITRTGGETFGNVTLAKGTLAGLNVNLACDVVINGLLTMTTGVIVIGSNNLTLNGTVATMTTTNGLSGTANSTLTIGGTTTTLGTLAFITTAQRLGTLSINRTSVPSGTSAVTLNSNLLVDNGSGLNNSTFTLSNGILNVATGFTLTVANTTTTGSNASAFVFTSTTGRFAYNVTGAGTYTLTYPLGSSAVTSPSTYRPLVVNSLVQSATNTYSAASTAGAGSAAFSAYTSPIVGVSTVRYFPFITTTPANLTSIGSVSLVVGADEAPTLDNLAISQVISSSWQNLGGTGTSTKTSTGTVSVAGATTYFAFGYNKLSVVYISSSAGDNASSGQNPTNSPLGTGPKLTMDGALAAVAEGGTIQTTALTTIIGAYTLNKNVNFVSGASAFTISGTGTVTTKAVFPFVPANVNTGSDEITVTGHQLATGMPVTYDNLGSASGFMPAGINTGADELTVGANIPTGQPVIYQAYPSAGAATGLTHGTTYFAINVNATTIKLATTYANALAGTPVVDITATGSALSHGIISSVIQGLTSNTVYYTIVVNANTIKLATTNANAISGTAIDLLTTGGGNHVVYFTPTYTGAGTFAGAATMTISEPQAHIKGYFTLTNTAPTITLGAGTYSMQPTINITKTMTLNGAGIGSTTLSGGGKISSATSYFGINLSGIAAGTVTISNLKISGYYNGIDRTSATANATTNIDNVESSDNFSRGVNFEGAGAITAALNIRNGIYSNNNGVGVNSYGINISGMSKTGINIRNNSMTGNRTSAVEIGTGAQVSLIVRGNTISGTTTVTPLTNGVTEMGIGVIQSAALTGSNSNISQNTINMYGRAGIECRGCLGNGAVSGAGSFRITSNYINQAGGPFTSDAGTSSTNETRDLAGIAVGNILSAGNPSGMVIDTNQIENLQQPNSASSVFTAFGIVSSGTSNLNRLNIVTGCEVGIQVQQGAPGNEATSGDNYYGRDVTATTTGFVANRNDITGNTVSGVRNEGTGAIQNFEGNWWGDPTGPSVGSNINPSGSGDSYTSTGTIAYNAWLAENPDNVAGTGLGQVGIQWNGPKHFRVKLSSDASSLSSPNVLNQAVAVVSNGIYTDTVDVHTGTYSLSAESVVLNRRVYFRGNFGLATKPVISGTGNTFPTGTGSDAVAANQILLQVTSRFCGIENFQINVNVPVSGAGARIGIGTGNNATFSRLRVKNNIIENFGSTSFFSWGMYLGSNSGIGGSDTVYVENNRITNRQGVNTSSFGRAIRAWYCNVQATGNTFLGVYSLQQASPRGVIGTNVTNNIMIGCHEINAPTGVTSVNISNNYYRVDSLSGGNHSANIEIRDCRTGTCPILIENNTFQGIGDAQCPYGVFSTMADDVTVKGNSFFPKSTANSFVHILSTTKHQAANPLTAFSNGIDITGNTFNGNNQVSTAKYGVVFANHNNSGDFNGGITLGTVAQPNTFKSNLSSWIYLDPLSGASNTAPTPYIWAIAGAITTMVPTNVNINATNNFFEVSGGTKLPSTMTLAELFDVEDMVTHAIDYGSLGFVSIKPSNAYVTTSSFISPETAPRIGRAVTVSSDGWTISAKSNTYAETVTVDKSITLQNDGTTIINNLTMNGTGKTLTLGSDFEVSTTGVLTLTDGLINTGSNFLRVTNTASGAIAGGSYLSHVLGNLNRAVTTGIQYDYTVGDGTDQQLLSLTFTTISSLTDVNVRYTTTAPGTNLTTFNESGALYDGVLQTGYWIVEPNVGGNATNYSMRLKPINFTDFPTGAGIYSYTILKRVGAGNWGENGVFDDPGTPERIFGDGTVRRSSMTGFSNFSIGSSQNVPLPLNLVYFSARKQGTSVATNWKTVNEKGVNRYELEKSDDGQTFVTIATEKSKNETGAQYTYSDADAFRLNQDVVFYRVKSVDQNGLPTYSQVQTVNRLASAATETLTLFPNPGKDKVYLLEANSQTDNIIVTDATGKTMNLTINGDGALNVQNLAPGMYHIRVMKDGTSLDGRFVKD